jgi:hypothetical protein
MYDSKGKILDLCLAYNFGFIFTIAEGLCTEKCELESLAFCSQNHLNETRRLFELFQICDKVTLLFFRKISTNP